MGRLPLALNVDDLDDAPREVYAVLADAPVGPHAIPTPAGTAAPAVCCATPKASAPAAPAAPSLPTLPVVPDTSSGCCGR